MYESYKMSGRTSDRLRLAKQSREEAGVNIAFFSVAPASRQYRRMLSSGYSELSAIIRQILATAEAHGELVAAIDVAGESHRCADPRNSGTPRPGAHRCHAV
jgi:hypothetical protein